MSALPIETSVEEVKALLDAGGKKTFRLIDCREEDEWRFCRIEGAELIPLSRFGEEAAAKLADPDEHVIIYCHHGMRSLNAAGWLRQKGHAKAQSMAGGIAAWSDYIDPTVPRY